MVIVFYSILDNLVQQYLDVYNDINYSNQLTENDVYFVYKGGNINRMFNKKMFDLFDKVINDIHDKTKLNDTLKLFNQEDKRSDFDCYVYINSNLSNYNIIVSQIKKILTIGLEYIKCNFDQLFNNYRSNGKFDAQQIYTNMLNDYEFKQLLLNHDAELLSIQTRNFLISKNQILLKNSKDMKHKIVHPRKKSVGKLDYVESSIMLYPTYSDYLNNNVDLATTSKYLDIQSNETCKNDAYISKAENITLYSFGNKMKFDIIRLKINNSVNINYKGTKTQLNCAYELIDAVVLGENNNHDKFILSQLKKHNEDKKYIFKYNYNNKDVKLRVTSIYYIIYDLYGILFKLNQFIWNDKKYEKRIRRLINLLLYKSIETGEIDKFLSDSLVFTKFITNVISLFTEKNKDIYTFINKFIQINKNNDDIELIFETNSYYHMFILYIIKYIFILNKLNNEICPLSSQNIENIIYNNYKINSKEVDPIYGINLTKPLEYFTENIISETKKFNNFINYIKNIVTDINIVLHILNDYSYDLNYYLKYDNIATIL